MEVINKIAEGKIKDIVMREGSIEITFVDETTYHYGRREGVFTPGDELAEFAQLARSKWCDGRAEYAGKGVPVYNADTIQEAQNEALDFSNFMAVYYWELERWKNKFNYSPEDREENIVTTRCGWTNCEHNEDGECQNTEITLVDNNGSLICEMWGLVDTG